MSRDSFSSTRLDLFYSTLKAVNAGIIVFDLHQRIVFWNDWMERFSYASEKDVLGKTLSELYPDIQSVRLLHAVNNALVNHMPSLLSQTLNKSPLPLFATPQDASESNRIQQAIQVIPIVVSPSAHYCMIQITDVSAAVNRESMLRRQALELRSKAMVDGLTGIANRRRFDEHGEEAFRSARRNGKPLSLIMIDIDHFKSFNDFYGHQKGDLCLIQVASALSREIFRAFDLVARYGGEEFAVILPDTHAEGALHIAGKMHERIESLRIEHEKSPLIRAITISMGVATYDPLQHDFGFAELISHADHALYEAKKAGRNRIFQDVELAPIRR